MVSRRRILSRSRDDLTSSGGEFTPYEEEEDVWYQREKLYRDHIQEVLEKWEQIDDEIWAKVIVLERNRRVAKAYARAPVLTVNGSDDGFDGFRIGLGGFDNPWRDQKTEDIQRLIGHGVKLKMDDGGNILVKRISKSNVYVKQTLEETAVGSEVLKLPQGCLELDKPVKLFDFKKFQQNMSRELKRAYPDRRKLEWQCLSALVFVRHEADLLDCPQWVMLVNMVAMDLLKSKLPPVRKMPDPKAQLRLPAAPVDEDPYSLASGGSASGSGSGSSHASGREFKRADRPPKLPPRDSDLARQHYNIPKPDYEDELEAKFVQAMAGRLDKGSSKSKEKKQVSEDPYYCGLKARVSNFAGKGPKKEKNIGRPLPNPHQLTQHPVIQHSRSYDSGMGASHYSYGHELPTPRGAQYDVKYDPKYDVIRRKMAAPLPAPPHPAGNTSGHEKLQPYYTSPEGFIDGPGRRNRNLTGGESPYEKIYGRLPLPNRAYVPAKSRTLLPYGWE